MKKKIKKIRKNEGAAMLISVIFFLFISLAIISGLVSPTIREFKDANVNLNSKKSYFLAESGTEDVFYRVLNGITVGDIETITLGSNSTTTNVNILSGNSKEIVSIGDVGSLERKTRVLLSTGAGVGFNYGIQSGNGGFVLSGGSTITGNVYSNGNIVANNGVHITGTAVVAGATSSLGDTIEQNPSTGEVIIGSGGVGDAWAYNVIGATVAGNLYCQIGSKNNKVCNTTHGIPPAQPLPFTQENIDAWKAEGAAGGVITGATKCPGGYSGGNCTVNYAGATFGPGKITGNLTVNGGGTLTLTGTVWVVGTITVTGGGKIKLPANFSQYSATIISDGYVLLNGGSYTGSGTIGSYLFVVTTNSGNPALTVSGGSGAIAVCAQEGTVALSGGISINAAIGKKITVTGGSNVIYQDGLASPSFQSGPSGGWTIGSWEESQ
jgi:hypothetical protein